jgi:hypothetical protein
MSNNINTNTTTTNDESVSNDFDFWSAATEFLKTQLNVDFEKNFSEYICSKNFNKNEAILFEKMLKDALSLYTITARLKNSF